MKQWIQNNFWSFFFGIFATVGTIMGFVFFSQTYRQYLLRTEGVQAEGEVIDVRWGSEGGSSPTIAFATEQGERIVYQSNVYTSPPEYEVGDPVTLWYDPNNPQRVMLGGADSWLVVLITGIFFLIFGGIGYGGLLRRYFNNKHKNWLLQNGTPVDATFSEVRYVGNLKVNGRSPYVIIGQWRDPATHTVYTFESDYIWYNPEQFLDRKALRVLIDPKNPADYTMDVSFLPEAGN